MQIHPPIIPKPVVTCTGVEPEGEVRALESSLNSADTATEQVSAIRTKAVVIFYLVGCCSDDNLDIVWIFIGLRNRALDPAMFSMRPKL